MKESARIGGVRLLRRPSGKRYPVLFLHGFLGAAEDWNPIVDLLGDADTAAIDLPGHAGSQKCDERYYSIEGIVELLDEVIGQLGGRVHLSGYSMGGRLALHYALSRPENVRSLLLESASPGIEPEDERQRRAALDETRRQQLQQFGLVTFLRDWYRQELFESMARYPGLIEDVIERRSGGDAFSLARALGAFSPGRLPSCWDRLARLEPRTTFVAGKLDGRYVQIGRLIGDRVEHAALEYVEDAGHNVHLERPERFAEIVKHHLNTTT